VNLAEIIAYSLEGQREISSEDEPDQILRFHGDDDGETVVIGGVHSGLDLS